MLAPNGENFLTNTVSGDIVGGILVGFLLLAYWRGILATLGVGLTTFTVAVAVAVAGAFAGSVAGSFAFAGSVAGSFGVTISMGGFWESEYLSTANPDWAAAVGSAIQEAMNYSRQPRSGGSGGEFIYMDQDRMRN